MSLPSRAIDLCSLRCSGSISLPSLHTRFLGTCCVLFGYLLLPTLCILLPGTSRRFFVFLFPELLNLFVTLHCVPYPRRFSSCLPWLLPSVWGSSRRFRVLFPLSVAMPVSPMFRNSWSSLSRSLLVKSLSDFAAGLDDDLLLCPVRALRIYLDRTLSLAPSRRRLFVSPSCPTRTMSKNAVSFFLREVIHGAEVGTVRAHDIRGVSTSVAFHRNWSVSAVLDAGHLELQFGVYLLLPA